MIPINMILRSVLLVAVMGVPALGATVQISWSGDVKAGFSTTFNCSSPCAPNCVYTWTFKGTTTKGNTFTWTPDGLDDSVELQCTVHNPKTGTSDETTITVEIENQLSVRNNPPRILPNLNQTLNLLCFNRESGDGQSPSGTVWYKDGQKLTLQENMQLQQDNLTLHFDSLLPSDAGFYRCETFLPALQRNLFSSGYRVSFDPWNVSISGPDVVFVDTLNEFRCLTSCTVNVDCTVSWTFRGGFPVGNSFSLRGTRIEWNPSRPQTFQNFTCVAENEGAGRSVEGFKRVEVKRSIRPTSPPSGANPVQLSGLLAVLISLGLLAAFHP